MTSDAARPARSAAAAASDATPAECPTRYGEMRSAKSPIAPNARSIAGPSNQRRGAGSRASVSAHTEPSPPARESLRLVRQRVGDIRIEGTPRPLAHDARSELPPTRDRVEGSVPRHMHDPDRDRNLVPTDETRIAPAVPNAPRRTRTDSTRHPANPAGERACGPPRRRQRPRPRTRAQAVGHPWPAAHPATAVHHPAAQPPATSPPPSAPSTRTSPGWHEPSRHGHRRRCSTPHQRSRCTPHRRANTRNTSAKPSPHQPPTARSPASPAPCSATRTRVEHRYRDPSPGTAPRPPLPQRPDPGALIPRPSLRDHRSRPSPVRVLRAHPPRSARRYASCRSTMHQTHLLTDAARRSKNPVTGEQSNRTRARRPVELAAATTSRHERRPATKAFVTASTVKDWCSAQVEQPRRERLDRDAHGAGDPRADRTGGVRAARGVRDAVRRDRRCAGEIPGGGPTDCKPGPGSTWSPAGPAWR